MQVIRRDPEKGYLDVNFWLPRKHCNADGVKKALTFQFAEKSTMRVLTLYRETAHHLIVPREFWQTGSGEFNFPIIDCRPQAYPYADIQSRIKLDHYMERGILYPTGDSIQEEAMDALLAARGGILQLACGRGKTVVLLDFAARMKVPTLIVVDTTQLIKQWMDEIELHLTVPGGIGMIGDGEFDWKKSIVLATYHTIAAKAHEFPEEARRWFGLVAWDEGHHLSAPTFCRGADLFFGKRVLLTATPDRADGYQVVYNFHVGNVLYKNLKQDLKPRIYFKWTGMKLDLEKPEISAAVRDTKGELHLGLIAGYFGKWKPRLDFIINEVRQAAAEGRKILVLSKSLDEVTNLLALWNNVPDGQLYTDLPFPTAQDVGETITPLEMPEDKYRKLTIWLKKTDAELADRTLNPIRRQNLETQSREIRFSFDQHRVFKKCVSLHLKRQKAYREWLLAQPSTGGLMIHKVDVDERTEMLRTKQVTFAIMKYGREGLNEKSLDTIIACEPISDKNALQQLMGRALRKKEGKKDPVVVFLEDEIGLFIGMCAKLRQHLKSWPVEEGGPFAYEQLGNPHTTKRGASSWQNRRIL